jgi:hypothetical protein
MNAQIQENINAGRFVIICLDDVIEPTFWDNQGGWTPYLADATFFDLNELSLNLPCGGAWIPAWDAAQRVGVCLA